MLRRGGWMGRGNAIAEPAPRPEAELPRHSDETAERWAPTQALDRVGLFWSPGGIAGPADAFCSSGKYVAAEAWTQALVRHGRIPHIDLAAPSHQVEACRQPFEGMPSALFGRDDSVLQFVRETELPAWAQRTNPQVLHSPLGLDLTQASYLRSRFMDRIVPATCSQYGISYSFDLHNVFIRLLTTQIYPCDAIVCPTGSARQALEARLNDIAERYCRAWERPVPPLPRLEVIPWGVDTERFAPRDRVAARRELNLPIDRPILLCVGRVRIEDKMDWTPLLLAFARLCQGRKERPLLVLAGSNPSEYGEEIVAQAAQMGLQRDVRTFFNMPPLGMPVLYAACDVFVSPTDTLSETFGLTMVEAMASGRPVVASDWDGYKELIVHGETGFRVRTDWADCLGELDQLGPFMTWDQQHLHAGQSVSVDIGELVGYLRLLLDNPERREAMGRQGRERVEALYHWPVVIQQWEALWAELAAVAQTVEARNSDRMDYLTPSTQGAFAHFASRLIEDSTPVKLTQRGRDRLAGEEPLWLHPRARGVLRPQLVDATLAVLKPAGWMGVALPAGAIVEALQKRSGLSRERAWLHLMWLAKYDLISLDEGRMKPTT